MIRLPRVHNLPLNQKLILMTILPCLLALVLVSTVTILSEGYVARRNAGERLSSLAAIVAANSTAALAFDDVDAAREVLTSLDAQPSIVHAAILAPDGSVIASRGEAPKERMSPADAATIDAGQLRVSRIIQLNGKPLGRLILIETLDPINALLGLHLILILLAAVGALIASVVLFEPMRHTVARPLLALTSVAAAVSRAEEGTTLRAPENGRSDEIGVLTRTFNRMLDRIDMNREERKRAEDQIRELNRDLERKVQERTARLEAANLELESFSYSVSHDLRAPLRHIAGFSDLLNKHAGSTLDEKGARYLATIGDSARRMGLLIDDLLAFSRAGRTEMQRVPVSCADLVREVVAELVSAESGDRVSWCIGDLPEVDGDPALLRQVFRNLLSNAVKYSSKSPSPRVEVTAETTGGFVTIRVRDNGVGFDMEYAHKLFGVFQRLHPATDFEGTGIGLANVRRIVTRHGGQTGATGKPGEGATFFFSLPVVEAA